MTWRRVTAVLMLVVASILGWATPAQAYYSRGQTITYKIGVWPYSTTWKVYARPNFYTADRNGVPETFTGTTAFVDVRMTARDWNARPVPYRVVTGFYLQDGTRVCSFTDYEVAVVRHSCARPPDKLGQHFTRVRVYVWQRYAERTVYVNPNLNPQRF